MGTPRYQRRGRAYRRIKGIGEICNASLKYRFYIAGVSPEILFYVMDVIGITRSFDDQPAAPAHLVEGLFDLFHVYSSVVLQPDTISIGTMDHADIFCA